MSANPTFKSKDTVDGGPYSCGKHDEPFTTTDPNEWSQHLKEEGHFFAVGTQRKCVSCGEMKLITEAEEAPITDNHICPECGEKLLGTITKAKERKKLQSSSKQNKEKETKEVSKKK